MDRVLLLIWDDYTIIEKVLKQKGNLGFSLIILNGTIANMPTECKSFIGIDSIQNGVVSIQRVLGVVQDFINKDDSSTTEEYKPRPLYKHFED